MGSRNIAIHLDILDRALSDLERYGGSIPLDDLILDGDRQRMVLNAVYTAAQSCIDIASHVVADRGLGLPSAYRDLFPLLEAAGIITHETSESLVLWAGLRNVVAHLYWKHHFEQIHSAMTTQLIPLREFAAAIARLLASEADDEKGVGS